MTDRERELLERCLRLELKIAKLEGRTTESPPPPAPVLVDLTLRCAPATQSPSLVYRIQRRVTPEEATQMRELKRRGFSNPQIGQRVGGFSECTVRRKTKDVLLEQETAAT